MRIGRNPRSVSGGASFGVVLWWGITILWPSAGRADQPENRPVPPIDREATGDLATLGAVGLGWSLTGVGIVREDLDTIAGGVLVTSYLPLGGQVIAGKWKLGLSFTGIKMLGFTTFLLSSVGDEANDVIRKGPFKASLVLVGFPSAIEAGLAGRDLYRWYTGRARRTDTRGPAGEKAEGSESATLRTNSKRLSLLGGVTLVHDDDGSRTRETDLAQAWLTLGERLTEKWELIFEAFVLRNWNLDEEELSAKNAQRRDTPDTLFSIPLPILLSPVGFNLYFISRPRYDLFAGAAMSLLTGGEGDVFSNGGLGPFTAHLGSRFRVSGNIELLAQLKYLDIFDFTTCDEPDECRTLHPARRIVGMYGAGMRW